MDDAGKKLFHAIVVVGCAIGGCARDSAMPRGSPAAGMCAINESVATVWLEHCLARSAVLSRAP